MLSDTALRARRLGVVRIEVEAAPVVPVQYTLPSYVLGELSLTVAEDSGSVPTLTVLREVSDVEGDEVTVALVDASSPSALFSTLPTLSTSRFVGSGTPLDIVLSGGVLNTAESGVWTATLVLSDAESSTTAGVVRIEVDASDGSPPVNNLPSYVLGELLSLTVDEDSGSVGLR